MSRLLAHRIRGGLEFACARLFWSLPAPFAVANVLGPNYSLRCVLFHDVSDELSSFTRALKVSVGIQRFEETIRFLVKHYHPVSLQELLSSLRGDLRLPERPLLITFDDAYASVLNNALPILASDGVPSAFFVNGSLVGNRHLSIDNLLCYVASEKGLSAISQAATFVTARDWVFTSLDKVITGFLPTLSQPEKSMFVEALEKTTRLDAGELAREARLYLSEDQLRRLASYGCEIGNHTYSHTWCRTLTSQEIDWEIQHNKCVLERLTQTSLRSFSVPYGSAEDLTTEIRESLESSGHEATFLVEGLRNGARPHDSQFFRVTLESRTDAGRFFEIEVLPRLRAVVNRLRNGRNL